MKLKIALSKKIDKLMGMGLYRNYEVAILLLIAIIGWLR